MLRFFRFGLFHKYEYKFKSYDSKNTCIYVYNLVISVFFNLNAYTKILKNITRSVLGYRQTKKSEMSISGSTVNER